MVSVWPGCSPHCFSSPLLPPILPALRRITRSRGCNQTTAGSAFPLLSPQSTVLGSPWDGAAAPALPAPFLSPIHPLPITPLSGPLCCHPARIYCCFRWLQTGSRARRSGLLRGNPKQLQLRGAAPARSPCRRRGPLRGVLQSWATTLPHRWRKLKPPPGRSPSLQLRAPAQQHRSPARSCFHRCQHRTISLRL